MGLKGNVGFLDIDLFVDPAFAGDTSTAAMNFLANTDGLIVDLRHCPGRQRKNGSATFKLRFR